MRRLFLAPLLLAATVQAQTWNSAAGGYNTGYGTVYGSIGLATATQQIYNTTQLNIQRAMARQALINQHGLAAVEKAEREAAAGKAAGPSGPPVAAAPAPRHIGRFKPDRSVDVAREIAGSLGQSAEDRKNIRELVKATRQAFESTPTTAGWKNDVAGALAFFYLTNAQIAQDAPDPSDAGSQATFLAFGQTLDATPDFAKASNRDKAQLYETLIGFTALPLAIYVDAKERSDAAQLGEARQLSAQLLKLVLNLDAAKVDLPK